MSNTAASMAPTFQDTINVIHDSYLQEAKARSVAPEQLPPAIVKDMLDQLAFCNGMNRKSIGLYFTTICKITDRRWGLIQRLVSGDFKFGPNAT